MSYVFPYLSGRQTQDHEPTDWEMALADTLESIFARGEWELEDVVAGLNNSRVRPRQGGQWTADIYCAVMRELGA